MMSLKTAWAIVNKDNSTEIVSKKCRPNFESSTSSTAEFQVIYERFYFDDDSWKSAFRQEPGFWEYEVALDETEFRRKFGDGEHNP